MRKTVERLAYGLVVFTAALLWMALRAGALAEPGLNALLPTNQGSVRLSVIPDDQVDDGLGDGYWLFLPAFADRETLVLQGEGQEIRLDWTSAHDEAEGVQCLELPGGDRLHVMQSENLRALFLFSDDPVQQGRAWLEDCGKHERHTTGSLLLVAANGNVSHDERIKKLRGRGNGTWNALKKPYQIKLANKVDLLDRNELTEQKRTWVLLAMSTDPSLLRDRMALDMGLEMGLTETSGSEYVDLYYDGEYRGTYLLCEKVEIGKGRIQETDYGELVEEWNEALGLDEDEMETLPEGVGENAYGLEYHWVEGVQTPGEVSEGTYLLEMESDYTISNRGWFMLGDGSMVACKNPEYPNQEMMRYLSERLESARLTLRAGGVNPENGRTLEEDFDVDAFARLALLNEWAYNVDGFSYSSSFFILPAGESRFRPGPPWDFDLSLRYLKDGKNAEGRGWKDAGGWLQAFYRSRDFLIRMQEIYEKEMEPLVKETLLGGGKGKRLQSLDAYASQMGASRRMNGRLHAVNQSSRFTYAHDAQEDTQRLKRFISERTRWLDVQLRYGAMGQIGYIGVEAEAIWLHVQDTLNIELGSAGPLNLLSLETEVVREATEEDYAVYQVQAQLTPGEGWTFAPEMEFQEYVNGICENGVCTITFQVTDIHYRPFEYDDMDYGKVFDYGWYIFRYPDEAEEYGADPVALLEHFLEEDAPRGRMGTWLFSPILTAQALPDVAQDLGEVWELYYTDFIDYGYEDWPIRMNTEIELPITAPLEEH